MNKYKHRKDLLATTESKMDLGNENQTAKKKSKFFLFLYVSPFIYVTS